MRLHVSWRRRAEVELAMAHARFPRRKATMVVVALGVIFGALSGATVAWAFFSGTSATQTNSFTADTLPKGATPSTRSVR